METAVIEIGVSCSGIVSLSSGTSAISACPGFNSCPQCQQTVSVGRMVWLQLSHFKATKSPLSKSVNYFTLALYQTCLPLPPDWDRIILLSDKVNSIGKIAQK